MSKRESISRYNLIIKKLRKQPATFREISEFLARESEIQSYNFNVSKRTFKRDIEDISSIYNIEISYDFSRKVYFIEFDQPQEVNERILEAFDTFNALNTSDRISNYIHFESRRPQGTENLYGLLHSIKHQYEISFLYHKYWEDDDSVRSVEPLALKEFKNRWYLLAKDNKDEHIKTFALDRLSELVITQKKFNLPEDFSVPEYFKNCFGIIKSGYDQIQEVILSFDPFQGKYIKSMPLHETQVILLDNEDELLIKLNIYVTHDFIMELLSYGDTVKVLQPESLISKVKSEIVSALNQYR
jgi:predicted DNA-binding transcriptional regulator YafY